MWFVFRAIDPYTGPLREVEQLRQRGPRYYKATEQSGKLYDITKQAFYATKKTEYSKALELIEIGRKLDGRNPVFSYMEASLFWAQGDRESAVKAIDAGNKGGILRAYATTEVSPERWQWPEIDQVKNIGMEIVDDPNSTRAELVTALKLGQKIVWSSPPDFRRLIQGAQLRRHAAERLLPIAKEEGDTRLEKLCKELINESVRLRAAAKRRLAEDDSFQAGANAWVVSRALDKHDPDFRQAAMLLMKEKQAEWGREFRQQYLKMESLRNL